MKKPIRILFLAPHLSTGGMPAFLLKRIECLKKYTDININVIEFKNYSSEYVVQKNKLKEITNVITLGDDKMELIRIIEQNEIDIVHIDEMIEGFDSHNQVPEELMQALYVHDRTWRIVETCHNVWFNPDQQKRYHPDAYAFCTPYHMKTFTNMPSPKAVLEFPIEDLTSMYSWEEAMLDLEFDFTKDHVVNIGLWTPGKNQAEAIEVARRMPHIQFHFVGNQAVNFKDYWEPLMKDLPDNCKVWGEREDIWKFLKACDAFMFNSTWECNPLVLREAISYNCKILARNLPQYCGMFDDYITPIDENNIKNQLLGVLDSYDDYTLPVGQSAEFAMGHIELYGSVLNAPPLKAPITITQHFVGQPFLEIKGSSTSKFDVQWFDESGELHFETTIPSNAWTRLNRTYFTKWYVRIKENGKEVIYKTSLDYTGQRVYIAFDSKSLGDTLAWIPYCLEFKKKHDCYVIVSTFRNELFKDVYPELEFVKPGVNVENIVGMYSIGWFYDVNKEPELPNTIPLQKAASNILGLDYKEIIPRVDFSPGKKPYKKYITIATNSTAGCKFWTRESWQELINHYHKKGYKVVNVSLENNPFDNCIVPEDKSIQNTMNLIHHSNFFIGLSSGLSWLAWALRKEVVMISNFTQANHEFECIRVTNTNVCHGCWNDPQYKFDKGDWNWCPMHKGTNRQFECQTSITPKMVIDEIKKAGF
jgi:autotransporter strand-loop-strand O-heptosyltransferase